MAEEDKWEPAQDDDGNVYWYNSESGESAWELPAEAAAPAPEGLGRHVRREQQVRGRADGVRAMRATALLHEVLAAPRQLDADVQPRARVRRLRVQRDAGAAGARDDGDRLAPLLERAALAQGRRLGGVHERVAAAHDTQEYWMWLEQPERGDSVELTSFRGSPLSNTTGPRRPCTTT